MKKLSLLILAFAFVFSAHAQMQGYKWRFGASAGTTNYLGDIRPMKADDFKSFTKYYKHYKRYSDELSYQLSVEYALGNSVGLMLTGGSYQFGSSDRFIKNDGTLLKDTRRFDRALNFQTSVYDAGLSFVIKPDNDWLLSGNSFIAPYITVGAGVLSYEVKGDLLDADGNRYDYTNVNLVPDGTFETDLVPLGTERSSRYKTTAYYANVSLGVRFRITESIEIFAQSDFKRTNTDYLDDVSGLYRTSYDNSFQEYAAKPGTNIVTAEKPYRGMKDDRPDWYIYHGIGLKFSLGRNKTSFNPPVITQRYSYTPSELSKAPVVKKDSVERKPVSQAPVTNNYITVIQLPVDAQPAMISEKVALDSVSLAKINAGIDSLKTKQSKVNQQISSSRDELNEISKSMKSVELDTTDSGNKYAARIQDLDSVKSNTLQQMATFRTDSLNTQNRIDSLTNLKSGTVRTSAIYPPTSVKELMIYPGQVSRILYSSNSAVLSSEVGMQAAAPATAPMTASVKEADELTLTTKSIEVVDKNQRKSAAKVEEKNSDTMSRSEFAEEISKLRRDMNTTQVSRDSSMTVNVNTKAPVYEYPDQQPTYPQQLILNGDPENRKNQRKIEKSRLKQEKIQKKNNELLKDALLIGGTAATTGAIMNNRDNKDLNVASTTDSTLRARIKMDSLTIDSLSNIPRVVDTVTITEIQERNIETMLYESKVELYFAINEFSIADEQREKLAPVAEILNKNSDVIVELVGFADNTGSVAYNLSLTEKRVAAVTKALTDVYNIKPERISISNGGLIVRGKKKDSVETDRKVEIRVIKK